MASDSVAANQYYIDTLQGGVGSGAEDGADGGLGGDDMNTISINRIAAAPPSVKHDSMFDTTRDAFGKRRRTTGPAT